MVQVSGDGRTQSLMMGDARPLFMVDYDECYDSLARNDEIEIVYVVGW